MQAVLDQLGKLGGKPIDTLEPAEARKQPSPTDAVKALITSQGKTPTPEAVGKVENRTFPGPGGAVPVRIYTPAAAADAGGARPVVLYIHGGGWVIADLDTYDASPRAIANAANAIVVSTHYRQAPEHKFPAAHDDTLAAYKWVLANAASFGGDPKRVAVVGESAGGNMAANIALAARDQKLQAPVHQVLVYPVASASMDTLSYTENAKAKPLNKPMMQWFAKHYLPASESGTDPRISLVQRTDLKGLAPATVVLAQIDPLRSEGERYGEALRAAGVPVTIKSYDGVAHEFFGMGAVVDKAKQAQQLVGQQLKSAFQSSATSQATTPAKGETTPAALIGT
ncbi:MAG: Esterase/lipase [uncultured Lysobacter sp.]|uniref:Esterase/lipase n=1 Tax=uncultured Lysobacter sp. TaxID=271060 RepID=A0A6J4M5C0_9GAMM|nr:MAG: Esterase/lipase [uncultured Lysobacter sp.]